MDRYRILDFGKYGKAIAWLNPGRKPAIVELKVNPKNRSMCTGKASEDLKIRVLRELNNK
jgi:hypothetical protein